MENDINQLTHKIIGCSMEVHNQLGNGFQEIIYHRALAIELKLNYINFQNEFDMPIYYKGIKIGSRRVDFLINENLMIEIKAVIHLENAHKTQAINYCECYKVPHGLLINFGSQSLQFHRIYNNKLNNP